MFSGVSFDVSSGISFGLIAASTEESYSRVVLWSVVLIGALLAGFALVAWMKRRLNQPDEQVSPGFSLADLRDLHRKGQLSTEEYDRARSKLVASIKAPSQKPVQKNKDQLPPTKHSPPASD